MLQQFNVTSLTCLNDACKKSHGPYFSAGRQTVRAVAVVIRRSSSRWLRRLELEYTRGKTVRSGGIKAVPLQIGTATSPLCSDERPRSHGHRHDNPGDENPTTTSTLFNHYLHHHPPYQVNKVALNNVRKGPEKKKK